MNQDEVEVNRYLHELNNENKDRLKEADPLGQVRDLIPPGELARRVRELTPTQVENLKTMPRPDDVPVEEIFGNGTSAKANMVALKWPLLYRAKREEAIQKGLI